MNILAVAFIAFIAWIFYKYVAWPLMEAYEIEQLDKELKLMNKSSEDYKHLMSIRNERYQKLQKR